MTLRESGEMYLETIYILSQTSKAVRGVDIGAYMGFSKPSVSRALGILKKDGLVMSDAQGYVKLTDAGEQRAKHIYERHLLLTQMLVDLGVDEKVAAEDACRIEHYLSDETFAAIKAHAKKCGSAK
ncbi:MAG: metal-dependent transcriptional regulator [Clostridia bacterium]|nr:metal-dependent transcriptional regulator [Clostridia bacterium]